MYIIYIVKVICLFDGQTTNWFKFSGHPVPGVIWLMQPKNNTDNIMIQLNSNERYIMKQTATSAQFGETFYSSLTIKDITRNDMGTYSCKAQNKIGTNNSTVIELFRKLLI